MNVSSLIAGLGLGAGFMYYCDSEQGRRRRKLALDQTHSLMCDISDAADVTWRDLRNRSYGTLAQLRSAVNAKKTSDHALAERVRSKLGRYTSHPRAVEVTAHDGHVTLTGPILASEVEPLISCIKSLSSVSKVDNRLEVHSSAENISALQGGEQRAGERLDIMQHNWSPTTRLIVGALGGGLWLSSAGDHAPGSLLRGTIGMGLLACSIFKSKIQSVAPQQRGRRDAAPGRLAESAASQF